MNAYYQRITKPLHITPILTARFWKRVQVGDPSACWEWLGGLDSNGYGTIRAGNGDRRHVLAHRISFAINKGELIAGLVICHSCDNPKCVNPAHLFQATQRENTIDAVSKGRLKPSYWNAGVSNLNAHIDEILDDLRNGKRQSDVAAKFGISQTTVSGIKTTHLGLSRRITDEQALAIHAAYRNGEKPSSIANRTRLNKNTIKGICSGRNYACLKEVSHA